jgi:hypothetical protein
MHILFLCRTIIQMSWLPWLRLVLFHQFRGIANGTNELLDTWIRGIVMVCFSNFFRSFTNCIKRRWNIFPSHRWLPWWIERIECLFSNFKWTLHCFRLIAALVGMSNQLVNMKWRWNCQNGHVTIDCFYSGNPKLIYWQEFNGEANTMIKNGNDNIPFLSPIDSSHHSMLSFIIHIFSSESFAMNSVYFFSFIPLHFMFCHFRSSNRKCDERAFHVRSQIRIQFWENHY